MLNLYSFGIPSDTHDKGVLVTDVDVVRIEYGVDSCDRGTVGVPDIPNAFGTFLKLNVSEVCFSGILRLSTFDLRSPRGGL